MYCLLQERRSLTKHESAEALRTCLTEHSSLSSIVQATVATASSESALEIFAQRAKRAFLPFDKPIYTPGNTRERQDRGC